MYLYRLIFLDKCTYCYSETEVAELTGYVTQAQYTDTRSTRPITQTL